MTHDTVHEIGRCLWQDQRDRTARVLLTCGHELTVDYSEVYPRATFWCSACAAMVESQRRRKVSRSRWAMLHHRNGNRSAV